MPLWILADLRLWVTSRRGTVAAAATDREEGARVEAIERLQLDLRRRRDGANLARQRR